MKTEAPSARGDCTFYKDQTAAENHHPGELPEFYRQAGQLKYMLQLALTGKNNSNVFCQKLPMGQ